MYELNHEGCHEDCFGCYAPGQKNSCFKCADGLKKIDDLCVPFSEPCPADRV